MESDIGMKKLVVIFGLLGLTACGADGPPIKPSIGTTVSVGTNGISARSRATITSGPVNVGIKL